MKSPLPGGRLAEHLDSLSRERVWFAIDAITAGIAFADRALPGIGFAPLYMPTICGASWALGANEGYFVAGIAALLAIVSSVRDLSAPSPLELGLHVAIPVAAFAFIAVAISSFRRSYERELFHAHRDRMTGTLNKEVFHRRCARTIEDAGQAQQTMLLVILDLDDFKEINSREGHLAGDDVLRTFARAVSAIMRREDLIGRIGGDEFAMLVRVPSIADGEVLARDIHARLSGILLASSPSVTCSMGALLIPPEAIRDTSELMHAADQAMYRAKHGGKDSVVIERAGEKERASIAEAPAMCWEGVG